MKTNGILNTSKKFNNELNKYFNKLSLDNINLNNPSNPNNGGNSTNAIKKVGSLHRRYYSNSYIGENSNKNILDNFSRLSLIKDEDNNNNDNFNGTSDKNANNQININIIKQNTPIITFNRKKVTISPLQSRKDKLVLNNNNSNNNFFSNGTNNKSFLEKNNLVDNKANDYGSSDLKQDIKRNLQLPNLFQENNNDFKKINNNKSFANIKRINNSVTPTKFIYNSPNLNNMVAKKDINGEINRMNLKKFNYPSSTQVLHNRVN